ncbi:NYN domain-containing protein [Nocardioides sp. KIGAM211]|uniref:NYN domain-containing protein n=1 Tax=Nocardioides luti TaxID=2761101 RepID=A0A7X0RG56_9ACTN|nr:NYN domain-containing protein [Nocardioides luti]
MADTTFADLPDAVRTRVVALTADALPDVVRLPPALRRVADFAPARRARLGATAIGQALVQDDDFRDRVGTQVAARVPAVPEDAGERAAVTWLTRPEGWHDVVVEAVRELRERPAAVEQESGELDRLRRKVADVEQAARDQRALHRAQVDELKGENTTLRRKLGEARATERATRAELADAVRDDVAALAEAGERIAAQDKELRRLRAQVAQHDADAAASRRSVRVDREEATVRARLLLTTVIEAAAGLQRELGLPSTTGAPGDRVEAEVEAAAAAAAPSARSAAPSPAVLEQQLAMPGARLVVDGYNVTKAVWPASSLEAQRIRLLNGLAPLVARSGVETTVVFDAASSSQRPVVATPRGVKVLFSPQGVIADDVIRDLVDAEPTGRLVLVVTDDRELATSVERRGARTVPARTLESLLQT